jgi:hypothetical protein
LALQLACKQRYIILVILFPMLRSILLGLLAVFSSTGDRQILSHSFVLLENVGSPSCSSASVCSPDSSSRWHRRLTTSEEIGRASSFTSFTPYHSTPITSRRTRTISTRRWNWMGDLWTEVIEFSTYGPSERKLLKAKREQQAVAAVAASQEQDKPMSKEKKELATSTASSNGISLQAFQDAAASVQQKQGNNGPANNDGKDNDNDTDFDGYALRDLLVARWGVPLDVDFEQRSYSSNEPSIYVTVLPYAFGNRLCRHDTELDYLMHLQAVIEILIRYDQLEPWLLYLESTYKSPKPGIESVPFRLQFSPNELTRIVGQNEKRN